MSEAIPGTRQEPPWDAGTSYANTQTTPTSTAGGGPSSSPREVAGTAKDQASDVANQATEAARDVAGQAKEQVKNVANEAGAQARELMDRTRGELRDQAQARTDRVAGGLRSFSEQLTALAEGRPEEAGQLTGYARQAQQQVSQFASRLESGGFDGAVRDMASYARRRPMVFLAGCAAAGFFLGRTVRAARADSHDSSGSQYGYSYGQVGTGYTGANTPGSYSAPAYSGGAAGTAYGDVVRPASAGAVETAGADTLPPPVLTGDPYAATEARMAPGIGSEQ
jgi:hypothetical protein